MHFTCAARTDVGIVRSGNEDNYLMLADRGVFIVGGRAAHPGRVRDASTRVAADLAPLVRGIEVAVAPAPVPESVPVGAMLATDGLQYVQTRDGAKHLSLIPESIGELSDPPTPPAR